MSFSRFFILPFVLLSIAQAGTEVGNPTDNAPVETGSAWFLGENRTIHYCIDSANDFGVPTAEAGAAIASALTLWKSYLRDRGVTSAQDFKRLGIGLSLNFQVQPNCDGQEDLKFYLGSSSAEVVKAQRSYTPSTWSVGDSGEGILTVDEAEGGVVASSYGDN